MNRTTTLRVLPAVVIGLLLCAIGLLLPEPGNQKPFSVAVTIWPGIEKLLRADDDGVLKDQRINLVEMSWPTATLGAFRKRVVEAVVVTLDELLRLEAEGGKPRAVLVIGTSKGADAILSHADLSSMQDMRGKRVGVEVKSAGEYLLVHALAEHGMTLQDVNVVPINLAESETAYDERDLDALVTSDPWRARLQDKGAKVLYDSSQMGLELSRVLAVREDALQAFPNEVRQMIALCLSNNAKAEGTRTDEEIDATLRREGLTLLQWQKAAERFYLPEAKENHRLMTAPDGISDCLKKMTLVMRQQGLLSHDVKIPGLLNPNFLPGNL